MIILLILLLSFNCSAASLPDVNDSDIQEMTIEDVVEYSTESSTEETMNDVSSGQVFYDISDYGYGNLVSFDYIRELPDKVSQADLYVLLVRLYNLCLLFVWVFVAFSVMDIVAKSIGRLKRKN